MRSLDATLPLHVATEEVVKNAFAKAGYGQRKIEKWWDYYRGIGFIKPVSRNGQILTDENGRTLYSSEFWLNPLVIA